MGYALRGTSRKDRLYQVEPKQDLTEADDWEHNCEARRKNSGAKT
jgi:hypothetical protein